MWAIIRIVGGRVNPLGEVRHSFWKSSHDFQISSFDVYSLHTKKSQRQISGLSLALLGRGDYRQRNEAMGLL